MFGFSFLKCSWHTQVLIHFGKNQISKNASTYTRLACVPDYFLQKSYKKSTNNSCKIGFVCLKPNNKIGVVTAQFSMVVQFKDVKLQENMFA